jgi:hypothetical protein
MTSVVESIPDCNANLETEPFTENNSAPLTAMM